MAPRSTYHFDMADETRNPDGFGKLLWRGESGYETARRRSMWNQRIPDRFPDAIYRVHDVYDVVSAVKLAKQRGLKVSVKSGGHSWSGNHLREGGLLIDMSAMQAATIDKAAMRATTEPGKGGSILADMLLRQGLFFPTGHCRGVCVGGFLLQGGFGWHSRTLGPACMSVIGLDLVTMDGDVVHASPTENADLYWAARGSGPGFFAVVTRFHLRVYPRPRVMGVAYQHHPMEQLEDVYRFAHRVAPDVPNSIELQFIMSRRASFLPKPGIEILAPIFADSVKEAWRATEFLRDAEIGRHATLRVPFLPATLSMMYTAAMQHYPDDHRWAVDNMWTRAPIDDLLPGIRRIAETMPEEPAHFLWMNWSPPSNRPDMAFSVEDKTYLALYGGWKHAADDEKNLPWATDRMREMAHLSTGCQLADENLRIRPSRFLTEANMQRLDKIRHDRDCDLRFHSYQGRP